MSDLTDTPVVTCFLRNRGEVLLLKRSEAVGSYAGRWGAVAGYAEGDPDAAARKEIDQEAGLLDAVELVRSGTPFPVPDEALGKRWIIHPYLFDCTRRAVQRNEESVEAEWVHPTELLRRETVPELWMSYVQVAPTAASIAEDRTHGSAYLSLRALEVLRDWAGRMAWQASRGRLDAEKSWQSITGLAWRLLAARPAMAALQNCVHRAMHACHNEQTVQAAERAAREAIAHALAADDGAVREAAALAAGKRVLTLSRSGTVGAALRQSDPPPAVCIATSHPGGEGIGVAERLAAAGLEVTLLPDAALAHVLSEKHIDLVLTGADAVLPSGTVVNKTGTPLAALAARHAGIPFYVACATDKIRTSEEAVLEDGPPEAVYAGDAPLRVLNPTFEPTPTDLVTGFATERGVLAPKDVSEIAEELRALAGWEGNPDATHFKTLRADHVRRSTRG